MKLQINVIILYLNLENDCMLFSWYDFSYSCNQYIELDHVIFAQIVEVKPDSMYYVNDHNLDSNIDGAVFADTE